MGCAKVSACMSYQKKLDLLTVLFVTVLILANLLGAKIIEIHLPSFLAACLNVLFYPLIVLLNVPMVGLGATPMPTQFFNVVQVSVGIFIFPLTFLATDIVEEVAGKGAAKGMVHLGLVSLGVVMVFTALAVALPPAARSIDNQAYTHIFGSGLRMTLASLLAFVLAQYHDVWAFNFLKQKTQGRHLWLRNNLATVASQFIDTVVFFFVAFYQLTPKFTVDFIVGLMIPYWIFKILFALLDTPLCYWGVQWLKQSRPAGVM
jgi:uncharacterized integral membrane protein (TIGR00697 family)